MSITTDELYTVAEVARMHKRSTSSVWADVRSGRLPVVRLGRSVRIAPADLEAFIESHRFDGFGN